MRQLSLRARMAMTFGLLIAGVAIFMVEFFPDRMQEQARASTELRAQTVAQVIASAIAPAVEFDDADNAGKILGWLGSTPDTRFALVERDDGTRFAAWGLSEIPTNLPPRGLFAMKTEGGLLVVGAPITGRGDAHGELYIGFALDRLAAEREAARATVFSASIVVFAIGLFVVILLATALVRPIQKLTVTAREIAGGKRPPKIATVTGGSEVVQMTEALGTMLVRLNDVNSQLVAASRQAGMAEVATGVLHNVGNILTSVNVGISVVAEKVAGIPTDRVRRASELLGGARKDGRLDDAKLDAGVQYIQAIADKLTGERAAIIGELDTLRGHVDHVSRVVSMQNAYARISNIAEHTSIETLVDEAVALGCPDPARHSIVIERRVEGSVNVPVDRHRILQIFVNLLANARDSIAAYAANQPTSPRKIAIGVEVTDGWLQIAVEDTGGGITPELQLKIFSAGFTTKPKGHGYGLHSSALAAEQLGGTLRCNSAGPGKGACFTLRVPIARSHVE
jgi:signal transduction histidine kinase